MNKPTTSDILLELHVPDFDIVREFYKKLGFEVVWERKPDGYKDYMVMKRLESVICFWGGMSSFTNIHISRGSRKIPKEVME